MRLRFERFHPLTAFLYYAGAISLYLFMLQPYFLICGLVIIIGLNLVHDQLKGLNRWKFFLISTFFIMLLFNPIFNERGRHLLFKVGEHRFTLEAFLYGGMNGLSIIGILSIFVSYNVIMTPNKLLYLFSKMMPQFAVLLMLTLRFIPLMRRRVEEISLVQKSKGISVHNGKWKHRVQTGMLYVQTLLTYSLEEAIQTADSMKARGYGEGTRTSYEYFTMKKSDIYACVFLLLLFSFLIYRRFIGEGVLTIYPLMESVNLSSFEMGTLFCYLSFLAFPLFIEVGEWIRWRLSN